MLHKPRKPPFESTPAPQACLDPRIRVRARYSSSIFSVWNAFFRVLLAHRPWPTTPQAGASVERPTSPRSRGRA